ncbi:HNH endonuclease [Christensenellaceae bacterium OttesenSCG-928-L17]|nr:HNH endonuclease [Christensenellaceae bacterium OttesenSCG-928-L17]
MSRRSDACSISARTKEIVWERDGHCCILCGSPYAKPEAHFIGRAQNGKGVEQNIVTLCRECHTMYDQSEYRPILRERIRKYLQSIYPAWDEKQLEYRKWG